MSIYDQNFRDEVPHNFSGKYPYIEFADQYIINSVGYLNNSLEGLLFDDATLGAPAGSGIITIPALGNVTPKFYFYTTGVGSSAERTITVASITDNVCTITTNSAHAYIVGDLASITGVDWDATHPNINGTWKIKAVPATTQFTFEINAPDTTTPFTFYTGKTCVSSVFEIRDDRVSSDVKGQSFTSIAFTPKSILKPAVGYERILPSDLYTRFRFQTGSDVTPQGGINSNLFNVVDDANNNIKPVLWAYFFGYSTSSPHADITAFEIMFGSYAIVLRPSGNGSRLEFALVKFNWPAADTRDWMASTVDTDRFNQYVVGGTDLGYLISTNPEVGQIAGSSVITEIAKSDSFTYDSEFAVKLNLKITIRKHMLTDSILDNTYLVNLMVNDDYDKFGEGIHYDSILHGYITKPSPNINTVATLYDPVLAPVSDLMLMPIMYFKFNNTDEDNVGAPDLFVSPIIPGSSKIVQDNLIFKQLNPDASYLY
jgi:hypothetical protein